MLRRNWRLLLVALTALLARVLLPQLLPFSPTLALPLSSISQVIGMIPTAALLFNSFVPIVSGTSLSDLDLTTLNSVWRIAFDVLFATAGVWVAMLVTTRYHEES